jgi:hypothetical protein
VGSSSINWESPGWGVAVSLSACGWEDVAASCIITDKLSGRGEEVSCDEETKSVVVWVKDSGESSDDDDMEITNSGSGTYPAAAALILSLLLLAGFFRANPFLLWDITDLFLLGFLTVPVLVDGSVTGSNGFSSTELQSDVSSDEEDSSDGSS